MYAPARRRFLSRWWSILFPARWRFPAVVAGVALVLAVAVVMAVPRSKEKPISMQGNVASAMQGNVASAITTDLTAVARRRVFYGHQSVGRNVLDAVPGVYAEHGVSAPPFVPVERGVSVLPIEEGGTQPGPNGGFIAHQLIGQNGKPLLKLKEFDRDMRGGMGRQLDVALMNIDVRNGMDVDALFARYRETMGALERDFPNVTFIHVTVPVFTDALAWGKPDDVAAERFNALIRGKYGGHHLFDLAAIESTKPDGTRVSGSYDNHGYFALYDGYAEGDGFGSHLNAVGAKIAATAFLEAIAQASRK
jgi:hypothetical protein